MKANSEVISVESLNKILSKYMECYTEIYFRGEVEDFLRREPSIMRDTDYLYNEHNFYKEMMEIYPEDMNKDKTYIGKLGKMQHYGIPTRLLDVTINPLIALYFACEPVADQEPGYLYMYIRESMNIDSRQVKLASMRGCFSELSLSEFVMRYNEENNDNLSDEQVIDILSSPIFIKASDINSNNERLKAQDGTFVICGEEFQSEEKKIIALENVYPVMVLRIPSEFKESIRDELDKKYGINVTRIYPELVSGAVYLKQKYHRQNYVVNINDYEVVTKEVNTKNRLRRNSDIRIVIKKALSIKNMKEISKYVANELKNKSDVIWIYVALSNNDVITHNWRLRGIWINPSWNNTGINSLSEKDIDNYSWESCSGTSIYSEFNDMNVFQDDKYLLTMYSKLFVKIDNHYIVLTNKYKAGIKEAFWRYIDENKKEIDDLFLQCGDVGVSTNSEFNEYINLFSSMSSWISSLVDWKKNKNVDEVFLWNIAAKNLNKASEDRNKIIDKKNKWMKQLGITEKEINEAKQFLPKKKLVESIQAIPVSDKAIDIYFELKYRKVDKGIIIEGQTNLYDNASLIVNIQNYDKSNSGSCKVLCVAGRFETQPLGKEKYKNRNDKYKVDISLSIPSVQSVDFLKLAGMQYENMKGEFIDRTGIGPTGRFQKDIVIE